MPLVQPQAMGVLRLAVLCQNPGEPRCKRLLGRIHFGGPGGIAELPCAECGGISAFENHPDGVHAVWVGVPDGAPRRR